MATIPTIPRPPMLSMAFKKDQVLKEIHDKKVGKPKQKTRIEKSKTEIEKRTDK